MERTASRPSAEARRAPPRSTKEMDMEVDEDEGGRREGDRRRESEETQSSSERPLDLDHNPVAIERILAFGRELQSLHTKLSGANPSEQTKRLLQVTCLVIVCFVQQ